MKTIFLTGGTGVIGSTLVPNLLSAPDTSVILLIRAKSQEHLKERFEALMNFWQFKETELAIERIEPLLGDVTKPNLGLREEEFKSLSNRVTHIIHSAGNVKLNQAMSEARTNTVTPLKEILALARACQKGGQLQKVDYVSTIGVAGRWPGLVPEIDFRPHKRQFRNTYETAKAEGEDFLLNEGNLPLTIHRPSMVVGHSQTGKISAFQVFYHLSPFLAGTLTHGWLPKLGDHTLDLIPVDYVSRAITISVNDPSSTGKIFHLCSGPESCLKLSDLVKKLGGIFEDHGVPRSKDRSLPLPLFQLLARCLTPFLAPKTRKAMKNLSHFLKYLKGPQVFDNSKSDATFKSMGLSVPAMDSYLKIILEPFLTK